jgi:hypothetical protein
MSSNDDPIGDISQKESIHPAGTIKSNYSYLVEVFKINWKNIAGAHIWVLIYNLNYETTDGS